MSGRQFSQRILQRRQIDVKATLQRIQFPGPTVMVRQPERAVIRVMTTAKEHVAVMQGHGRHMTMQLMMPPAKQALTRTGRQIDRLPAIPGRGEYAMQIGLRSVRLQHETA